MTSTFGIYFVITVLAMIPLTLLCAGKDTTHRRAERREHQREVLLDWTDKTAVHGEAPRRAPAVPAESAHRTPVEVIRISREAAGIRAA